MSLIGSSHSMRNTKHQVSKKSYAKLKSVGKIEGFLLIDLLNSTYTHLPSRVPMPEIKT